MERITKYVVWILGIFYVIVLILPQNLKMPVQGATNHSYNQKSFWFYPWGKSGTHKGVDIFAPEATPVIAATSGIILYSGEIEMGGNIVLLLGPKWRIHYYAHLKEIRVLSFSFVKTGSFIGSVGTTGNAKGKPPHLHYAIVTLIPYLWRIDSDREGWKKIFYLNPIDFFALKKIRKE